MAETILVTGAAGNVGSAVVNALRKRNATVKAALHHPEKAAGRGWDDVEIVHFDWEVPETWEKAFADVDRIMVIAPTADIRAHERLIPALDAARRGGIKRFVNLSAMGVENADQSPLRIVEKHLEDGGAITTFLRPNWFMQNFGTFLADNIRNAGAIYLPTADAKTSFIDVRDIGAVAATALTEEGHEGKSYALTGEEALDHHEVAAVLSDLLGRTITYVPVSEEQARQGMLDAGWPSDSVEFMLTLYSAVRAGWAAPVSPNVRNILGRAPITFRQYAADYADAWKQSEESKA